MAKQLSCLVALSAKPLKSEQMVPLNLNRRISVTSGYIRRTTANPRTKTNGSVKTGPGAVCLLEALSKCQSRQSYGSRKRSASRHSGR